MKWLIILCCTSVLFSCSFGGFKPPKPYYVWHIRDTHKLPAATDTNFTHKYLTLREKEMRSCGMDPVRGESGSAKANLCLEQKGWYLEGGPVCENELMWNESLCIQWRAKHSKPNAKPWGAR